jgi:CRISPR-associated endonuclease/helicase Cas3
VFREALAAKGDILEHHASFDWEKARGVADADSEGPNGVEKLRRAAENWDVPIVVTTAVQFFESLYANRTSHCRKLHNIARSVVILDEAQTIPVHLLRPCTAAINELASNYRTTVVLCTATQPALRAKDGFTHGLAIDDDRELAPDPQRLYAELKRVTVETRQGETPDADIAARVREQSQMLCIVNSRAHARALFDTIRALPGAIHLTTLMCPVHRREKLGEIRAKLKAREPVRLVATSLVEAGVDVDFPEVWRAAAGLDSIAQAAGRCNREGGPRLGRVVVFTPAEAKPPHELKASWQAAKPVLRACEGTGQDILSLDAVRAYFKTLYWQKGDDALDAKEVDGLCGILAAIGARAKTFDFPFASIASAFRIIDTIMDPVIVPFDERAEDVLKRVAAMERPLAKDLRILQQYTISIPRSVRDRWWAAGVLTPVHTVLEDGLLRLADHAHYSEETGLDIADATYRSAESNLM